MNYLVIIEKADHNYSAYVPDLPGCVATGKTRAAVRKAIQTAVKMHLQGMREDGERIPKPHAQAEMLDVA
ncbi:MAG: type II toxin-antitoxin system HicB family antitoxin [Planctomycetaceae bacterium]|nr:type II toxin-antitoxin system HicB family antitoxin [Planctomycetaceae bacterium]